MPAPAPAPAPEPVRTRRTRQRSLRTLLGAFLALLLGATAAAAAQRLHATHPAGDSPTSDGRPQHGPAGVTLTTEGWPQHGQAAYVLGDGRPATSPGQQPVPIASVAKVMTAYLILKHYPLQPNGSGRSFSVRQADVTDTLTRRRQGQSVVDVRAGEQLTERDVLMAIMLPSANNIAVLAASEVDGGTAAFVAEMNQTAHALGMSATTYTDPSGFDPHTVSTAADQLRLAQVVADDETLAGIMATRSYPLPVAGQVANTDTLLGQDGFVGMKTGSEAAAGGCFMFRSERHTANGDVTLIGVVLGQQGDDLIAAGLNGARDLVDHIAPDPATSAPGPSHPEPLG